MPAFAPLVGPHPRVLILGSMPGQQSLAERQYYAHPRNSFWWIMSAICGFDESLDYVQRIEYLYQNGIAVWDVLHDCVRPGSLDANIERGSEQVNDFSSFLSKHATIQAILFNGAAAETIFNRHFPELVRRTEPLSGAGYWGWRMPSTSPAHASLTRHQKLLEWRRVLQKYCLRLG